ncbi:MAG: hypothetical protein AB1558_11985, partial [Thermodesulfobacteriota bacterium]
HRPEDMGLLPDGATPLPGSPESGDFSGRDRRVASFAEEPAWGRAQASHTGAFRALILLSSLIPFVQAGVNFHIYPFLTDQGFGEMIAVTVLSTFAVFGMVGSAVWGMLSERFRLQSLLAVNLIGNGLIFLLLYWAVQFKFDGLSGMAIVFALASLHGIFHGGRNPMIPTLWANFFGRNSLGSIYSLSGPFYFTANAVGPFFGGLCYDLLGSYAFPFHLFVVLFLLSGIVAHRLKPPAAIPPVPAGREGGHSGMP